MINIVKARFFSKDKIDKRTAIKIARLHMVHQGYKSWENYNLYAVGYFGNWVVSRYVKGISARIRVNKRTAEVTQVDIPKTPPLKMR